MLKLLFRLLPVAFAAVAAPAVQAESEPPVLTEADYDRAARLLVENGERLVLNAAVKPHWLPDGDRFWYRRQTAPDRAVFVVVDAAGGGIRKAAFDHVAIAAGLSKALGKDVAPDRLPFDRFRYGGRGAIEAIIDGKLWSCSVAPVTCRGSEVIAQSVAEIPSPDSRWRAFVRDDNIWIKPSGGGESFALTTDGAADFGWATQPGTNMGATAKRLAGKDYPPALLWSPDSKRLLTQRMDDRKADRIGLLQSVPTDGSVRPKLHSWRMPMPGDPDIPTFEPWVFDIATRHGVKLDVPPIPFLLKTSVEAGEAWWSEDSKSIGLIVRGRYLKDMKLYRADPATGRARLLLSEESKTFIEPAAALGQRPMIRILDNGEILWFSERDGHGRLYLYGSDGRMKRVLGTGEGQITSIVRLDQARNIAWVRANGRGDVADPYLSNLYSLNLKTGAMARLTPEDADHSVGFMDSFPKKFELDPLAASDTTTSFSPSGAYFVDTYSTVETPPVSVLRRSDGTLVTLLERADPAPLKAEGFTAPERFTAMAADGTTVLYGAILRPSNFDPSKRYPVIDSIYPGPQARRTPDTFMEAVFDYGFASAMAELGFVVVLIDGRGTPRRHKAFLNLSYGKLANGGFLEDHVAAIRELGRTRRWMDLDRVGIYGISGGGYATARAMFTFPDFYKVGVAHAGNHDQRGYIYGWGESYNGPIVGDNYTATSNAAIAKNLKGKLLLMHGDMDSNVSPALTLQVADALIKANKDFDLMIIPNLGHAWGDYGMRVTWDYMVRNLMGATPPKEYALPKPSHGAAP
jgi:dipeptidyl aminopeptidase/acylaminoacyl peptidase